MVSVGHEAGDGGAQQVKLVRHHVEYQFVVDLHYHARTQAQAAHLAIDGHHCHLDDVGG